jgi:hypothetical protein
MYLLLLGTTALSLVSFFKFKLQFFFSSFEIFILVDDYVQVTTPLLFKLIPAVMNLGVLMHWFPSESDTQNEVPLSLCHTNTNKYIHLQVFTPLQKNVA